MLKLLMISGEVRTLGSNDGGLRRGFTLFEVAISLVLVSFGVISVMMLFPIGIKAEQMARLRLYAGAKAEEIIDGFATLANTNPTIEVEAPKAWDVPAGHRPFCPDLESRMVGHRTGIMPVPLDIAKRLDSNNDEIQKILSEGGQLYYSQATGATGLEESGIGASGANMGSNSLSQRLVFAVVGYAQNNNVPLLAQKAWPYYSAYPSPPGHGEKSGFRNIGTTPGWRSSPPALDDNAFTWAGCNIVLWEGVKSDPADSDAGLNAGSLDPDIKQVFALGFRPYSMNPASAAPPLPSNPLYYSLAGATQYLQVALWYCLKKGLPASIYDPTVLSDPFDPMVVAQTNTDYFRTIISDDDKWAYVQALRFLSHAATCMTKWKALTELGGQPSASGSGVNISPFLVDGINSPSINLTHDKIVYYHELCMRLVKLYSASQPYDWGAPRPTQNPLFTDYPLIEYDLFTSTSGPIEGSSPVATAEQWKPITARPVRNIGRSYSFPNTPIPNGPEAQEPNPLSIWGQSRNFTLARPFVPAERCRQLVFWTVDWMSYEDCETAPSAPLDASKYMFSAPLAGQDFAARMNACTWCDHHLYAFRNPEKAIAFWDASVLTMATGTQIYSPERRVLNNDGAGRDQGSGAGNKNVFLGRYGADRNFDGILDRGLLKKSIRLRAATVSRYNFYDPRLTVVFR
jgi:hypothetical protein